MWLKTILVWFFVLLVFGGWFIDSLANAPPKTAKTNQENNAAALKKLRELRNKQRHVNDSLAIVYAKASVDLARKMRSPVDLADAYMAVGSLPGISGKSGI